jgi:hypothetical protein
MIYDVKGHLEWELQTSRHELRGIESEIARLTDRRFDKLLSIASVRLELLRLIPEPSAASKQYEVDRENQAVGG